MFLNFVKRNNLEYEYVHTSGHVTSDRLKLLVDKLQPKTIIPIHTNNPEKVKEIFKEHKHNVRCLKDKEEFIL